jgi:hypothetical protein
MSQPSAFQSKLRHARTEATADQHVAALRASLITSPEVKEAFNIFPPINRKRVNINSMGYSEEVGLSLSLSNLSSFKDKQLLRLLERFSGPEWRSETRDFTYGQPNRDYSFTRTIPVDFPENNKHARWLRDNGYEHRVPTTFALCVRVYAYVRSDSPTCRIVVTGVKEEVIRSEVKEIVCE